MAASTVVMGIGQADLLRFAIIATGRRKSACEGDGERDDMRLDNALSHSAQDIAGRAPDLGSWHRVSVHRDCHVQFERVLYSAPFTLVGKTWWLRATDAAVTLFEDLEKKSGEARNHCCYVSPSGNERLLLVNPNRHQQIHKSSRHKKYEIATLFYNKLDIRSKNFYRLPRRCNRQLHSMTAASFRSIRAVKKDGGFLLIHAWEKEVLDTLAPWVTRLFLVLIQCADFKTGMGKTSYAQLVRLMTPIQPRTGPKHFVPNAQAIKKVVRILIESGLLIRDKKHSEESRRLIFQIHSRYSVVRPKSELEPLTRIKKNRTLTPATAEISAQNDELEPQIRTAISKEIPIQIGADKLSTQTPPLSTDSFVDRREMDQIPQNSQPVHRPTSTGRRMLTLLADPIDLKSGSGNEESLKARPSERLRKPIKQS